MLILGTVDGIETVIIGYAPGKTGPMIVIPFPTPSGEWVAKPVKFEDFVITNLPAKLKRKLKAKKVKEVKSSSGEIE